FRFLLEGGSWRAGAPVPKRPWSNRGGVWVARTAPFLRKRARSVGGGGVGPGARGGAFDPGPQTRRVALPILRRVHEMRSPMTGSRVVGIVDDDASLLRALRRLLQAVGFTVETFESGEEFVQSLRPRPNCLVLDIHLGTLTGFDLHE